MVTSNEGYPLGCKLCKGEAALGASDNEVSRNTAVGEAELNKAVARTVGVNVAVELTGGAPGVTVLTCTGETEAASDIGFPDGREEDVSVGLLEGLTGCIVGVDCAGGKDIGVAVGLPGDIVGTPVLRLLEGLSGCALARLLVRGVSVGAATELGTASPKLATDEGEGVRRRDLSLYSLYTSPSLPKDNAFTTTTSLFRISTKNVAKSSLKSVKKISAKSSAIEF